mgnify:CR=1 FL=1
MAVPKGFRTNINVNLGKIGVDKRQEILDGISNKGTFLPRGVSEEDMDISFKDFVVKDLGITIDGVKVPVLFLTIQRWSEFSQTWNFADKFKDIQLPFITIVRRPDIQQGQNQAGLWNIPGNRTYTYMKVPTWDGARKGVDLYQIPQPTSVDITYEVRMFTNKMRDLNKVNGKIQRLFQSRQFYINPNGHPMPIHLENIGDESNIDDFENRRFYVQLFEMKLLGYLLDEDDFKVVPTINRTLVVTEVEDDVLNPTVKYSPVIENNEITATFEFSAGSVDEFIFTQQFNATFTSLLNVTNIYRITIGVNHSVVFDGLVITSPIVMNTNDIITIRIYKDLNDTSYFQLKGTIQL